MKNCIVCLNEKPLVEFPKHYAMADGHLNKCKNCMADYQRKYRATSPGLKNQSHKTNQIRGLLCSSCNMGLGKFKDNPKFLMGAIKYLARVGN